LPQYEQKSKRGIKRTFIEFVRLSQYFIVTYPGCIIPVLPTPRSSIENQTKSDQVICHGLQLFLNRLFQHSTLNRDLTLQKFIELEEDFSPAIPIQHTSPSPNKLLSQFKSKLKSLTKSEQIPLLPEAHNQDYIKEQKLASRTQKLMSESNHTTQQLCHGRKGFIKHQLDVAHHLTSIIQDDPLLTHGLNKLSTCLQQTSTLYQKQASHMHFSYIH
jgi:hypothetical protein